MSKILISFLGTGRIKLSKQSKCTAQVQHRTAIPSVGLA